MYIYVYVRLNIHLIIGVVVCIELITDDPVCFVFLYVNCLCASLYLYLFHVTLCIINFLLFSF